MATLSPVKVARPPQSLQCRGTTLLACIPAGGVILEYVLFRPRDHARDMAGKGVRVVGPSADRSNLMATSSDASCEIREAPNSQEEPGQLAAMLLKSSSELAGAVIFPTRDADVLFLDRFREILSRHYRLAIPTSDCLLRVMNKHALAVAAQGAGIPDLANGSASVASRSPAG